jgi:opacity protein-like surface antigen
MKLLLSAAFASLTLAPAVAADLFGSAPPLTIPASQAPTAVEVGSNWYLRGEIGVGFDDLPTVSLAGSALPALPSLPAAFSQTGSNGATFDGGLGVGYRFNDYLRFDATWDYRFGPGKTLSGVVVCPYAPLTAVNNAATGLPVGFLYNPANACYGSMSLKQYNDTLLANAYVDLGTYYGFTPYVGAGLGMNIDWTRGSLNFYQTSNAQPYAANLTNPNPLVVPSVWVGPTGQALAPQPNIAFAPQIWNRSFSSTTYRAAWALMAGVGFQLSPSATLDVGYRYLNAGETTMVLNPLLGLKVKQNNVSQQILVGIRYALQ